MPVADAMPVQVQIVDNDAAVTLSKAIPFAAPFMPPWRRPLDDDARHRLLAWCDALLPGERVHVVEWVGADTRQPSHAVVLSFPKSHRASVVLHHKLEAVRRQHLVALFAMGDAS